MQGIQDFNFCILLLSLSLAHLVLANYNTQNIQDYEALKALQNEVSYDPEQVLSSWNSSIHFCEWNGVTCGRKHRRVVGLDLSGSKLVGKLSPFIGNLSFLRELHLYNNSFEGSVPGEISRLPRLQELDLGINSFTGEIPSNWSGCSRLSILYLSYNNLRGVIPPQLSALPKLAEIHLATNNLSGTLEAIGVGNFSSTSFTKLILDLNRLEGRIPFEIGRLKGLEGLSLGDNMLSGVLPSSLFNLSSLKDLYLSRNNIHGTLPINLDQRLPLLQYLYISHTFMSGHFPASLSNLSHLQTLDLSFNSFTASGFSFKGNNMRNLAILDFESSFSSSGESVDLSFLGTLTNCTNLTHLSLGGNSFAGAFPRSIFNLSTGLESLVLSNNLLSGRVPSGLGKFRNLRFLDLTGNYFRGSIPSDFSKMESMEILELQGNYFSGEIPSSFGNLTKLSLLYMLSNNLEGPIPKSLGSNKYLQKVYLNSNKLTGVLPVELFNASNLIHLVIGDNNLQGSLPSDISRLKNLFLLNVSKNRFSGEIPTELGECSDLEILDMSFNSFDGSIPESLAPLKSIQTLNLSFNSLSGRIPGYFSSWPYLLSLNLSFNNLEGEVPTDGAFSNTSIVSVAGNSRLCGGVVELQLQKCPFPKERRKGRRLSVALIAILSVACALIVILLLLALCLYLLCSSRKRKEDASSGLQLQEIHPFYEVSYQMLWRATNGFSPLNLIGEGGFGSVYKGTLHQDSKEMVVAVKVLNLQNQGAGKSFIAECKALSNSRHRNLVKIITACSSIDAQRNDFKALVYEYMSMGCLENWLHPEPASVEQVGDGQSCTLSLFQRLNIIIDVASALEYLHTGCTIPIIHCDLKPTNILLDHDMIAHVGDFGLAKFLSVASTSESTAQSSSNQVRGTVGYAPPEYGLGSKASLEGDVYSFGIIALEMMTSKRPTDPIFRDGLNLHNFARSAHPDRVVDIVDQQIVGDVVEMRKTECINALIMIGVQCSMELPQQRMRINDALNELKSVRRNISPRM